MPLVNTKTFGIHQSDLIVRSAIMQGLADLRAKPWLLDFCFASLPQDDLTSKDYGQSTVQKAKDWFLQQEIPVRMNTTNQPPTTFPAISIQLASSNEDSKTHGDINYDPYEDNDMQWPILYGPFAAVSYTSSTGIMVLPSDVITSWTLFEGQLIVDDNGGTHPILEVIDGQTVQIDLNLNAAFTRATIRGEQPAFLTSVESVVFAETYQIGCHVSGEPEHLTWLHSIVTFILLAYKQTLLEARNFERSVISSADFSDNPFLGEGQLVYSRFITLSGYVRQMWPGSIDEKIVAIVPDTPISDTTVTPEKVFSIFSDESSVQSASPVPVPSQAIGYYVYSGSAAQPGTVDATFVQSLSASIATQRQTTLNLNQSSTQYGWYAYPSLFGGAASNFVDIETGFEVGVSLVATVTINGTAYNVWRTDQANLGRFSIQVT